MRTPNAVVSLGIKFVGEKSPHPPIRIDTGTGMQYLFFAKSFQLGLVSI